MSTGANSHVRVRLSFILSYPRRRWFTHTNAHSYKERILESPDTITVAGPGNKRKYFIFDDDLARMDEAAKEKAAQGKTST